MKRLFLCILLTISLLSSYAQIDLLIQKKNGEYFVGEYFRKTSDSLILKTTWKELGFSFDEIQKVQTLGVHFDQDAYSNAISNNFKVLDYDKLGKLQKWSVFVSVRKVDSTVYLLFKFKWDGQDDVTQWPLLSDNELISLKLSSGAYLNMKLCETYTLRGVVMYNFGYILLNDAEIKQLLDEQLLGFTYGENNGKVNDEFTIMRQLFAIFDEGMLWRDF